MKPILSFLLCTISFMHFSYAQKTDADSLFKLLAVTTNDSVRADVYKEIAYYYTDIDLAKARLYVDSSINLAKEIGYQDGVVYARHMQGVVEFYSGNREKALEYANEALEANRIRKDSVNMLKNLNFIGGIYRNTNQPQKALEILTEALEMTERLGDIESLGTMYHSIGLIHQSMENMDLAKSHLLKALAYFEELGNDYFIAVVYQGLSVAAEKEESLEYAGKALAKFKAQKNLAGQGYCYSTIGNAYYELEQMSEAVENWQNALEIFEQLGFEYGIASVSGNIGTRLTEMSKFQEAYPYLIRSRDLAKSTQSEDILLTTYIGLANYYANDGNAKLVDKTIDSLMAIKDSIYSRESADLLMEAEAKFQTKEKESQIQAQELQLENAARLRNAVIIVALLVIIALASLFLYIRNRQKLKQQQAELALTLEQAEAKQLRELDQLKSNFFANISHEFRTPLTLILGPLEEMLKKKATEIEPSYINIMYRNGRRLQDLINQLLDLSKLESNKMMLRNEEGDIVRFIRQIASSMESWAERKYIDYQLIFPPKELWVKFDQDKMEKILVNLLSNALKFTPDGGQVQVELDNQSDNGKEIITLHISDTGPGIPEGERDLIFERFYQSTQSLDGMASSGIGLALTKELIELFGGTIWVDSQEGKGTTFRLMIPLDKVEEIPNQSSILLESASAYSTAFYEGDNEGQATASAKAPLVLVVEDNADLRHYINSQLGDIYRIEATKNGKEGLKAAQNSIPDLIITDLMMPEMDGIELTKNLKTDTKTSHIPIIMLTAKAEQEDKIEGLETGADDYLTKPFNADELRARTKNLIQQRKLLREKFASQVTLRPEEVSVNSVDQIFLKNIMDVIESNMEDEQFGVETLAENMALSRSQLHRKLIALIDQTPSKLIRKTRLIRAKELLEQKAGNASEISFQVGFNSPSYFSKCFKDEFGISPNEAGK